MTSSEVIEGQIMRVTVKRPTTFNKRLRSSWTEELKSRIKKESDGNKNDLKFIPLTYNGQVKNDLFVGHRYAILRYTSCRCSSPKLFLWVSRSAFNNEIANFEDCVSRWGHLTWPGGLTFLRYELKISRVCTKWMYQQSCQIWRRYAPPFLCYLTKPEGGGAPPSVRGLSTVITSVNDPE